MYPPSPHWQHILLFAPVRITFPCEVFLGHKPDHVMASHHRCTGSLGSVGVESTAVHQQTQMHPEGRCQYLVWHVGVRMPSHAQQLIVVLFQMYSLCTNSIPKVSSHPSCSLVVDWLKSVSPSCLSASWPLLWCPIT